MSRNLGIVVIGDSHLAGALPMAPVVGSETLGCWISQHPLDVHWTGAADGDYFPIDNAVNEVTACTDTRCSAGLASGRASIWGRVCNLLRAGAQNDTIGRIKIANLAIPGSSTSNWVGEHAIGLITIDSLPNAGDTVTIDTRTYTFVAAPAADYEVLIGANEAACATNLANAIASEGAGFHPATPVHDSCFCNEVPSADIVSVAALTPGTAGNALALSTASGGRILVSGATLATGAADSAIWGLSVTKSSVLATAFGQVDVVVVGLGTQDAVWPGYRGRGTEVAMTALLADVKALHPGALIVLVLPPDSGEATAHLTLDTVVVPAVQAANTIGATEVDMYSLGVGTGSATLVGNDAIILSSYGYSVMAQLIANAILNELDL